MSDYYAIMGDPVAHSKSPTIYNEFAKQTGQDLVYEKIRVPPGDFKKAIKKFEDHHGKGLNVTLPFKEEAFELANERSVRAGLCKAVNTLIFRENGAIYGDITDGVGLVRDLTQNLHWHIQNKRLLILGAGPAVRGVITSLLAEQPMQLTIANRNRERSKKLSDDFGNLGNIALCYYEDLSGNDFDVIINATSASLKKELPPMPKDMSLTNSVCYDMFYADKPTVFLEWATHHGAKQCADGIGMLIEQSAESFFLWRGIRPDTSVLLKKMR